MVKTERKKTHTSAAAYILCPFPLTPVLSCAPLQKKRKRNPSSKKQSIPSKKGQERHTRHNLHLSPCRVEELLGSPVISVISVKSQARSTLKILAFMILHTGSPTSIIKLIKITFTSTSLSLLEANERKTESKDERRRRRRKTKDEKFKTCLA
jgi:hypothetical protein